MSTRTKGRGCTGKIQHPNRKAALGHLQQLARKRGANPARYQAYHCRHCGNWHIGHRPKPRRRRR